MPSGAPPPPYPPPARYAPSRGPVWRAPPLAPLVFTPAPRVAAYPRPHTLCGQFVRCAPAELAAPSAVQELTRARSTWRRLDGTPRRDGAAAVGRAARAMQTAWRQWGGNGVVLARSKALP